MPVIEKKTSRKAKAKPVKPAPIVKPTAGGQIELDELQRLESIRDDNGRDRTSMSFLVRLACLRLIADVKAKRVDFSKSLDDVRADAGLPRLEKIDK